MHITCILDNFIDILKSPADLSVNIYEKAVLKCSFKSDKWVNIKWEKGSTHLHADELRIKTLTSRFSSMTSDMFMVIIFVV